MHYRSLATLAGAALATASLILAVSAQPLPPTSPPQLAPQLPPAHVVDLLTAEGMGAFGAQWKHGREDHRGAGITERHAELQDFL